MFLKYVWFLGFIGVAEACGQVCLSMPELWSDMERSFCLTGFYHEIVPVTGHQTSHLPTPLFAEVRSCYFFSVHIALWNRQKFCSGGWPSDWRIEANKPFKICQACCVKFQEFSRYENLLRVVCVKGIRTLMHATLDRQFAKGQTCSNLFGFVEQRNRLLWFLPSRKLEKKKHEKT